MVDARTGQRLVVSATRLRPRRFGQPRQVRPIYVNFTVPQDVADEVRHRAIAPSPCWPMQRRQDPCRTSSPDRQPDRNTATGTLARSHVREHDERCGPASSSMRAADLDQTAAITVRSARSYKAPPPTPVVK
jgi:hypothetical protein